MPSGVLTVLPWAAMGTGAGILGGAVAALWRPGKRVTSIVQHFAAGVVLAAAALELLPDIESKHAPALWTLGGFAAGGVCMYLLRRWANAQEARSSEGSAGLVAATAADVLMDGVIVGAGFALGSEAGPLLAVGLSTELLFLGMSLAGELGGGQRSGWTVLGVSSGVAVLFGVGAVSAAWLMGGAPAHLASAILSFGAAALIYLVTEELLSEAHEKSTAASDVLVLFLGFLALWTSRYALQ